MALIVADDNALNVAFVDEFLHLFDKVAAEHLDFFNEVLKSHTLPITSAGGKKFPRAGCILLDVRTLILLPVGLLAISCGSDPKPAAPAEAPKKAETPKPRDETRRFPMTNLVDTKLVEKELMGKPFMPGGTVAHYKKGAQEWDLFLAQMPSGTDAALALPDWRKALTDSKLVPSFGGYYGLDNGRPVFVFSKGSWIAGVAGLPEKAADLEARTLAGRIQ